MDTHRNQSLYCSIEAAGGAQLFAIVLLIITMIKATAQDATT
jgi:hypothetical protein